MNNINTKYNVESFIPLNNEGTKTKHALKIYQVGVTGNLTPPSSDVVAKVQRQIDKIGIPLDCINPPKQVDRNDRREEAVQQLLEYYREKQPTEYESLKTFWTTGVDKITIEELEVNLASCTKFFDTLIKKEYNIGFVPEKSSKWIAQQAMPFLTKLPSQHFLHDSDKERVEVTVPSRDIQHFAIFDDASYTGTQIWRIISTLNTQLATTYRTGKLYLIIPFISDLAKKTLVNEIQNHMASDKFDLKIRLITSERKIRAMSETEFAKYALDPDTTVTFTEWKIPDNTSLALEVMDGVIEDSDGETVILETITNYPPCYKN